MTQDMPAMTPLDDLVERALAKMASGEWRLLLEHPEPSQGTSVCGSDIAKEIARRASLSSKAAPVAEVVAWRPIETAPKDGQIIWAWLKQTGVRAVRWGSAEEWAERDGGNPDDYESCWVQADDDDEIWSPRWWLPYDAIPEPDLSSPQPAPDAEGVGQ